MDTQEQHPLGIPQKPKSNKKMLWGLLGLLVLMFLMLGLIGWQLTKSVSDNNDTNSTANLSSKSKLSTQTNKTDGLTLDPKKNYGSKYTSGILPVGDNKYKTSEAKKGYIFVCNPNYVPAEQAGAQSRGPWFVGTDKWDVNKKIRVSGSVNWAPSMTSTISETNRVISSNNLPNHSTGIFPVASTDPAYSYDRNPNTIGAQTLSYTLSANPTYGSPVCMSGEVGVMLTGSKLFNAFDAGGRDAGAWEVQDSCSGHPQISGEYHYHTLSGCIKDVSVSTVIGFALDGFAITGPKVGESNFLTTDDLDECHGIISEITLDGKNKTTYHYVMTQDFPYSISCFRAQPVQAPGLMQSKKPPPPKAVGL